MADTNAVKKPAPPYVSYKTFNKFLEDMKVLIPARIDRSVLSSMSGAVQSALLVGLEYLKLVDSEGVPTEKLTRLVHSEGAEKKRALEEILRASYTSLFENGNFEIDRATSRQLEERFDEMGTSGDTTRKCIGFFMAAAKDAGIELSPLLKRTRGPRPGTPRRKPKPASKPSTTLDAAKALPAHEEVSLEKLLLAKFPSFDPAWPEEVQTKWFDGFKELMTHFKSVSEGE